MGRTTKLKSKTKISEAEDKTTFFYYAFRNILLVSIPLIIISALFLSLPHSSATTSSSDHVYFTLSTSCTMSGELISPHTIEIHGGQYKTNVGTTKLNTYCNDGNGYSIYAIGSSNNIDGNTDLINSDNNDYNISTGIYDSSTATVNTPSSWSMKLTAGTGSGNTLTPPTIVNGYDDYSEIPNVYTQVAKRTSETEMNTNTDVTGSYLTTTYAIYTSSFHPAGSYSGNVKYVMIHPNSNLNTIPNINTAFAVSNKLPAYEDENGSYYAMQDMNSDICSLVAADGESTSAQLVDIRDNKLYWVTKLKDGHCWMTQNLDLAIGSTNTPLTSENTDISTDPSVYSSSGIYSDYGVSDGVYTWNPVSTAITTNRTISGTTVSPAFDTSTNGQTKPYSAEGGDTYFYTSGSSSDDSRYNSLSDCEAIGGHTEAECKRYFAGNYYNWTAAIASNNSANIGSNAGDIADNSICPKGWRLPNASPTDNDNNEFGRLFYKAQITASVSNSTNSVSYLNGVTGFNKLRSNPYYFVRSGNISSSSMSNSGVNGNYWSSTASSKTHAYYLSFNSSGLWPIGNLNFSRLNGWSIRCLAK